MNKNVRILILDIETLPLRVFSWGTFDQNIPLNQIDEDWSILAWSAKWLGESKIFYGDQRNAKDIRNDKELLKPLWKLVEEAHIIVGQNSNAFDIKKLNARFIINGMQPPSSYKKIDTMKLAKKLFGFTSNKLEYLSNKLCKQHKLVNRKFNGFTLWLECMKGNKAAFKELKQYNQIDVLATEELYKKLIPWEVGVNFNVYHDHLHNVCTCGASKWQKNGHHYGSSGKYQRYKCGACGAEYRSKENLLDKKKRDAMAFRVTEEVAKKSKK